jgi:dynein heavy chain
VSELIINITEKSEIASVQQKAAAEKKQALDEQSIIIEIEEKEAAVALREALPALAAAKLALENVKKKDLDEIKALASPPTAINDVCAVCFFLSPKTSGNPDWPIIKVQLLSDTKLIDNLQNYDVDKTKHGDAINAKKRMTKIEKDNKNDCPAD